MKREDVIDLLKIHIRISGSQDKLAKQIGISPGRLSQVLNNPDDAIPQKVLDFLHLEEKTSTTYELTKNGNNTR